MNSPHRLTAVGNQLVEIHLMLREELARLRDDVELVLAGSGRKPPALEAHCLAFCSLLTRHHTGEEGGAFAVLSERSPALRPVIAALERDHQLVAGALRDLEKLLAGLSAESDPDRVRAELAGLSALLETHFTYEERKLVAVLNALTDGTTEDLLGLPPET